MGGPSGALLLDSVAERGVASLRAESSETVVGSGVGTAGMMGAGIGLRAAAGVCLAAGALSPLALAINPTTTPSTVTIASAINQRRGDQLRNCATSPRAMEFSVARATTADVDRGACDGGEGASETPIGQTGNGGGSLDAGGALAGAASAAASAELGVPSEVSVFRFCEEGASSPVPIRVANGDL